MAVSSASSGGPRPTQISDDQLRLMVRVCRLYHERSMRQVDIADLLHISQTRVSRLLRLAARIGVVRTIVSVPASVHADVEERLEERFGLTEAVVVDADDTDESLVRVLGATAGAYLDSTLIGGDTLGFSSWSQTLLTAVDTMPTSRHGRVVDRVVQVVGGIGAPHAQARANRAMTRLADLTGATPVFLPAPGLLETPDAMSLLMSDRSLREVVSAWDELSLILVGIGGPQPSALLKDSGNAMAAADEQELRQLGAVGDICLRAFDADGSFVPSRFNDRVAGISLEQFRAVPRRVGVAGGSRKFAAIRAALRGQWLTVLITDSLTAERLLADVG